MLADNLENILKVVGINDFPQEVVVDKGVYMEFPADLFSLVTEGIQNVSFLNNAIKRSIPNLIVCELRECVEGKWYRTRLSINKTDVCRVLLEVVGLDEYTDDNGYVVRGEPNDKVG